MTIFATRKRKIKEKDEEELDTVDSLKIKLRK